MIELSSFRPRHLRHYLTADVGGCLRVHEQGNNETVQTENFGENENKNHANKETWLLGGTADTGVTDNTNGESSSETRETDRQTSTELDEASVERKLLRQAVGDEDGHDETVDTNDTSHNNGNNVLDDKVRAEDTHGGDTDTRLGGTVGGAQACEDNGTGATHGAKEGRIDGAKLARHGDGYSVYENKRG